MRALSTIGLLLDIFPTRVPRAILVTILDRQAPSLLSNLDVSTLLLDSRPCVKFTLSSTCVKICGKSWAILERERSLDRKGEGRSEQHPPCGHPVVDNYVYWCIAVEPFKLPLLHQLTQRSTESLWVPLRPRRLPRSLSCILIGVVYHPPDATTSDNTNTPSRLLTNIP